MDEQTTRETIVGFLEGMKYNTNIVPSTVEASSFTWYLLSHGVVTGTYDEIKALVTTLLPVLQEKWRAEFRQVEGISQKALTKQHELNHLLFSKTRSVEWLGRRVVRVLALEGENIRLFFEEMDTTNPEKYTDVPYNSHLRICR